MPLITLTCKGDWYPPGVGGDPLITMMAWKRLRILSVQTLALGLPNLICEHSEELHLDPGTSPDAVQVDIRQFHPHAQNAPDLWVHVVLTEEPPSKGWQAEITERLTHILIDHFKDSNERPAIALDIFFGPGTGCFIGAAGAVTSSWGVSG